MGRESSRENSVVLMLTDSGLILNLQTKTKRGQLAKNNGGGGGGGGPGRIEAVCCRGTRHKRTLLYHFVRRSKASRGAAYRDRIRISTETTDEEGFFSVNVLT